MDNQTTDDLPYPEAELDVGGAEWLAALKAPYYVVEVPLYSETSTSHPVIFKFDAKNDEDAVSILQEEAKKSRDVRRKSSRLISGGTNWSNVAILVRVGPGEKRETIFRMKNTKSK